MNHHDKDFIKELNKLKINRSLDAEKKESMKMAVNQHAEKRRRQEQRKSKIKHGFIWLSTAAVIILCGVFLFQMIDNDSVTAPDTEEESIQSDQEQDSTTIEAEQDEHNKTAENTPAFSIEENGTETATILLEGMEEEVTVYNFIIEPYDIQFQIEEFLSNYETAEDEVRYYSDAENAEIHLRVAEAATIDEIVPEVQQMYDHNFNDAAGPETVPSDENPYDGVTQHVSDSPEGYYLYQIDDNVLIIQYEYDIEAADGVSPRLEMLRKSIQ
ncbi:hypothetical protein [Oceanobacillus sp. CFH 90083]|uniref:hypothetical protein n=1 Tax=Oceanobacillus sp. CFH 90083 TaxID=2592336 RepID=UPI00128DB98C|nr:hypothetical protein [Oceanobacillus sp. CFH 90083]